MTGKTNFNTSGDAIQLVTQRNDGSIRQVLVQDKDGNILAMGFYGPGTTMEDNLAQCRKYHWIDAWSDDELLDPKNDLTFTKEVINRLREESYIANINKQFVIDSLENYKKG